MVLRRPVRRGPGHHQKQDPGPAGLPRVRQARQRRLLRGRQQGRALRRSGRRPSALPQRETRRSWWRRVSGARRWSAPSWATGRHRPPLWGRSAPPPSFTTTTTSTSTAPASCTSPARIDEAVSDKIREVAVRAYRLLGCSGLARVDFFVTEDDHKVGPKRDQHPAGLYLHQHVPQVVDGHGPELWGAFGPAHRPGLSEGRQVRGGALWITDPSVCSTPA